MEQKFAKGDRVWVTDDDHYLGGGQYRLYAVDDAGGYIDHDGKAWHVPFSSLELVEEEEG